jgi:hypothetical protein
MTLVNVEEPKQDLKEIFYDYTYRDFFLAKMKDDSLVVIFKAYGKSSPLQDEFENLIDINTIAREANGKEYYDYFTQRGVKKSALCSQWRNEFKPIHKVLESTNNYDPQPIIVTLGHSKRYPNGHGMAIYNYTFDFKNNSLLSKTKEGGECNFMTLVNVEEPKQETLEEAAKIHLNSGKIPNDYQSFIEGAKWLYSEANKIMIFLDNEYKLGISDKQTIERIKWYFETYFEQFKNK